MSDFAIDSAYNITFVNKMLDLMKDKKYSTILIKFVKFIAKMYVWLPY